VNSKNWEEWNADYADKEVLGFVVHTDFTDFTDFSDVGRMIVRNLET